MRDKSIDGLLSEDMAKILESVLMENVVMDGAAKQLRQLIIDMTVKAERARTRKKPRLVGWYPNSPLLLFARRKSRI